MLSITTRLTLWYVAIVGGTIIGIVGLIYVMFAREQETEFDGHLSSYAALLTAKAGSDTSSLANLYITLKTIASQEQLRFGNTTFVLRGDGAFVFDSAYAQVDSLVERIQAHWSAINTDTIHTVASGGVEYRVLNRRLLSKRYKKLQLIVLSPLTTHVQSIRRLRTLLYVLIPTSLLLAGGIGVFISRRALRPVKDLTIAATEVSLGSLYQRVPVGTSADEVAKLATTFNEMIDRLERAFNSQRQFITDASHDLRTPLTIIRAELELLLGREEMTSEMARPISHSLREIEKLTELANDLLLLVKAESKQFDAPRQRIRLDELLVQCASDLNSLAVRKGTLLNVRIDEAVEIECDAPKVQRAITNILDNAIEYSPDCSRVTVELTELDNTARVVISDNGIGIPEQDMPRIFDRFYRSDRARNTEGSGLGLAIAKAVIEAHGGSIALTSAEGVGTRVTFTLPVTNTR